MPGGYSRGGNVKYPGRREFLATTLWAVGWLAVGGWLQVADRKQRPRNHALAGGAAVHASLLDPLATGALPTAAVAVPEVSEGAVGGVDLVTILLVLALALLCVEWGLYRTSRIP